MTGPFTFVSIISFLFSQAFAFGLPPLLPRQASPTSLPANIPTAFPPACVNQCNDVIYTLQHCYNNPAGVASCLCTQPNADGLANCLSCYAPNSGGSLTSNDASNILKEFVSDCNNIGISLSLPLLQPSQLAGAPGMSTSLSLFGCMVGCMIGLVLGAGMVFI